MKKILTLIFIVTVFSSCYYDKYDKLYPIGDNTCDSTTAAYSTSVTQIFSSYCYSCHNTATASGGVVLDTYADASSYALDGTLMSSVKQETGFPAMPPSATLSDCDIAKLQKWVNDGSPNN